MDFRSDKFMLDYINEKYSIEKDGKRRTSVYYSEHKALQDVLGLHKEACKIIYLRTTQPNQEGAKISYQTEKVKDFTISMILSFVSNYV